MQGYDLSTHADRQRFVGDMRAVSLAQEAFAKACGLAVSKCTRCKKPGPADALESGLHLTNRKWASAMCPACLQKLEDTLALDEAYEWANGEHCAGGCDECCGGRV